MECQARTVSHIYASSSCLLRPVRSTNRLVARAPALNRSRSLAVRPIVAVASFVGGQPSQGLGTTAQEPSPIINITSPAALKTLQMENPEKLLILMCKATGCRPCKAFRPKYGKLALHYSDALFCEILGDLDNDTRSLMRELKIKSTPTFVFFRNGETVHVHSGINAEKMVDALKEAVLPNEAGYCAEGEYAAAVLAADK